MLVSAGNRRSGGVAGQAELPREVGGEFNVAFAVREDPDDTVVRGELTYDRGDCDTVVEVDGNSDRREGACPGGGLAIEQGHRMAGCYVFETVAAERSVSSAKYDDEWRAFGMLCRMNGNS
ncbi:hypothetical protein ACIA78_21390 [Streptomyces xanthochromogenes]|uniref:hypothetical protein n=1 Tax=Streptomyces xanthochromogenes TaxID=67384 RepID=UPI00378D4C42